MAKQGMKRPEVTHVKPRNEAPPVPELQGKAKSGKKKAGAMEEIRTDPEERLCPRFDSVGIAMFPVAEMLKKIADLSGGEAFTASSLEQLNEVFTNLQEQIGYETIKGDASVGWLRLGALVLAVAALGSLLINRRLPN